jgi:hypothetical protein
MSLGLIVASLPLPVRVQRNRNDHVGAEHLRFASDYFGEPAGEPIAQAGYLFKLQ